MLLNAFFINPNFFLGEKHQIHHRLSSLIVFIVIHTFPYLHLLISPHNSMIILFTFVAWENFSVKYYNVYLNFFNVIASDTFVNRSIRLSFNYICWIIVSSLFLKAHEHKKLEINMFSSISFNISLP